jgi:hypothetical protein
VDAADKMNMQPEPSPNCILLAVCLFTVLMFSALFAGCKSAPQGPDPALFPDKAKEYNDGYGAGFREGFSEGLAYTLISQ